MVSPALPPSKVKATAVGGAGGAGGPGGAGGAGAGGAGAGGAGGGPGTHRLTSPPAGPPPSFNKAGSSFASFNMVWV